MKKYIIYIALSLVAAVSCEQLPDEVNIYGVGCVDPQTGKALHEVDLGIDAGTYTLNVYSDGEYTATLSEEDTWIRFSSNAVSRSITSSGNGTIVFEYDINKGIPRIAEVTLQRGTNVYSVSITQDGILEGGIIFEQKNISVPSEGGQFGAKVITKIKAEDLTLDVTYENEQDAGWISNLTLKNNFICFDVKANLSASGLRHAVISVNYEGGKGYIQVTQFYAGCDMSDMTVEQVKGLLDAAGEISIESHAVLNGIVINDHSGMNGAENRLVSAEALDLNYAERILYVQNAEGTHGIKLIFKEKCTDVIARYDRISVDLKGLTLKKESNPDRYTVSGIPLSSIVGTMACDPPLPRTLKLEDLSDSDVFTLVKVKDVEIPVRKGSFVPVDIRDIGVMVSYPMVIRSKGGGTSHLMVNVDCPWSRNGKELPRGSGTITGVVVHETCDNFEWAPATENKLAAEGVNTSYITGLGRLGMYQIRPIDYADINLSEEESFSTLMYEWGYCDTLGVNLQSNYENNTLYPTYPHVSDPKKHKAAFYCVNKDGAKAMLRHCNDFSHLGPYVYGQNMTDKSRGNGIVDSLGRSAFWKRDQGGEKYGVLYSKESSRRWTLDNGAAWCTVSWNKNQYWCTEFSTSELTEANSPLNLTFGTMGSITLGPGAPRYWAVECSVDGQNWSENPVLQYTVPDFVDKANRRVFQLPGTKYITVNLPNEFLGKDKVYVRLRPTSTRGGTAASYEGSTTIPSDRYNAINYVAIRYTTTK